MFYGFHLKLWNEFLEMSIWSQNCALIWVQSFVQKQNSSGRWRRKRSDEAKSQGNQTNWMDLLCFDFGHRYIHEINQFAPKLAGITKCIQSLEIDFFLFQFAHNCNWFIQLVNQLHWHGCCMSTSCYLRGTAYNNSNNKNKNNNIHALHTHLPIVPLIKCICAFSVCNINAPGTQKTMKSRKKASLNEMKL